MYINIDACGYIYKTACLTRRPDEQAHSHPSPHPDRRRACRRAKDLPAFFGAIASTAQQAFIPQTGAVLITDEQGAVVGAAGASSGTGDEDEQIVIAGIAAAGLRNA